jgi:hypothetical protein
MASADMPENLRDASVFDLVHSLRRPVPMHEFFQQSNPSIPGILMSDNTKSGRVFFIASTPSNAFLISGPMVRMARAHWFFLTVRKRISSRDEWRRSGIRRWHWKNPWSGFYLSLLSSRSIAKHIRACKVAYFETSKMLTFGEFIAFRREGRTVQSKICLCSKLRPFNRSCTGILPSVSSQIGYVTLDVFATSSVSGDGAWTKREERNRVINFFYEEGFTYGLYVLDPQFALFANLISHGTASERERPRCRRRLRPQKLAEYWRKTEGTFDCQASLVFGR